MFVWLRKGMMICIYRAWCNSYAVYFLNCIYLVVYTMSEHFQRNPLYKFLELFYFEMVLPYPSIVKRFDKYNHRLINFS